MPTNHDAVTGAEDQLLDEAAPWYSQADTKPSNEAGAVTFRSQFVGEGEADSSLRTGPRDDEGDTATPVPEVSNNYIFLGTNAGMKERRSASTYSTHQLRKH